MPNVTSDTNVIVDRDYSDNFSIKETALTKLGPKYFGDVELAGLNVGALGFTLEQVGNVTEDAFNTTSILINEAFPNKASIPESIYTHAAIFQMDKTFTPYASCTFVMLLEQKDVLEHGRTLNNKTSFYIDRRTVISVEDIPFTLDYDIKIDAQKKQITGSEVEYNYSAQYVIDSNNSISRVNDPYLKIRKTPNGLLILQFIAHQVERTELTDTIISNTKINYPVLNFEFTGSLAGFDIFYKAPSDTEFTQLSKRIMFSLPIKTPFCYYRLQDTNKLAITFSTRDGYFQPEFNSEIKVILYTTKGSKGNFDVYNGTNIEFTMNNEKYSYNDSLSIAAKPVSDSQGGADELSLEALQALTVEAYSTATELSTENDIQTYFYNYKYRYGNEIMVIKRRDDITERLFSAFLLVKNGDYIYPTNTLHLNMVTNDFDSVQNNNIFTLKPGHVFVYEDDSNNTVRMIKDVMAYESDKLEELVNEYKFVYTNPFMISLSKSPSIVGLYKTISNETVTLDFISSNEDSFTQFISSKINLFRGLNAESEYRLSMSVVPSSSLDEYIETLDDWTNNDVRIIAGFENTSGDEIGYIELYPTEINPNDKTNVTFSAKLITDDKITSNNMISILNGVNIDEKSDHLQIPIKDAKVNIYILYYDGITESNKFDTYFDGMKYYGITNTYSTNGDNITLVNPMNMMRSTVSFSTVGLDDGEPAVAVNMSLLPMIKADIVNDKENFDVFIERVTSNYNHLQEALPILRNNTHIDVKFYNTYGKSSNYHIGDNEELIDTVNIKIAFKVSLYDGADDIELKNNLKVFIKEFIENVNSSGTNDLYISNLITEIERNFASVHHLKFMGINDYSTDYQTISVKETDLNNLNKEERRKYVPEVLVVDKDNVLLSLSTN